MISTDRSLKIGMTILVIGMLLSLASAWCEIEAHLNIPQPVQEVGISKTGHVLYKPTPPFYLASSMAIRLFSVGALLIVVGTMQVQRSQLHERVARLEKELETFRRGAVPV